MFTYRYRELAVALEKKGEVRSALAKTLRVNPEEIFNLEVERFSLDSRRKGDLRWSYNVVFDLKRKVRATGNNARGLIEAANFTLGFDEPAGVIPRGANFPLQVKNHVVRPT